MFFGLNPWAWIAIALAAVGIFGAGYGCKAISAAEERGEIKTELATANATLTGLQAQQDDLKKQRDIAQAAAAKIPPVVTNWMRDNNAVPIAPGCEAAMNYGRARAPILSSHRQRGVIQ